MAEPGVAGDLVLEARTATPETFEPFGRLLYGGDRARIGGKARVLVALDSREEGPRRVGYLQRYPEAARFVMSVGEVPLALVVAGFGDEPPGAAATAFTVPGSVGVLLHAGVWHAGPIPLAPATVLEMLEIRGPTDRLDRRTVADHLGVDGLRISVAEGASAGEAEHASAALAPLDASVAPGFGARGSVALLEIRGVDARSAGPAVRDGVRSGVARFHAAWLEGEPAPPAVAARLEALRGALEAAGVDPDEEPSALLALVDRLADGGEFPRADAIADAVAVASLETLLPASAHDRARLSGPLVLRVGAAQEGYAAVGRAPVSLGGRPVLADATGPFSSPAADAVRTRPTLATEHLLVVVHLPEGVGADPALDRLSAGVTRLLGGREVSRRVLGGAPRR